MSVGRHQRVDPTVSVACERAGVELVRRPTGGTAVLHDGDVTYSVVAPSRSMSVLESYRWVAGSLVAAFERLNLTAYVSEHAAPATRSAACFASSTGADLSVGGAKVCGSAQVRRRGWFLQHGSIPITDRRRLSRQLLGFAGADASTCLDRLRPGISGDQLSEALLQGFAEVWGEGRETDFRLQQTSTSNSLVLA